MQIVRVEVEMKLSCENKSGGNGNGEIIKWTMERGGI